ncbi:SapC family protein [Terrarubrum flagellatum]|uniref:SapC family protein n=1 Tax=Terrirubrum flagellatum TaxID=2895980 RepID=UPI003144D507
MDAWAQLYEAPAALSKDWGHHRIYAPAAYRLVRTASLIPIVHAEILALATLFPTCWATTPSGPVLSVLRTLLPDGAGIPGGEKGAVSALPLAFQAYPIVTPHEEGVEPQRIFVDRAIADAPTDIGAPLMLTDGRLARATAARARTALQAGRALPATRALSRFLHEEGLLEPWPLRFDLGEGESVDIDHLMVLSRARLDDPAVYKAIRSFGIEAALFMSTHRLSLFRVSGLLSAAKAAIAARAKTSSRSAA